MATVTLKPAEGRRVLNHERGFAPLNPAGEPVTLDATWRKRLADGDVVMSGEDGGGEPQADPPAPAKKSKS